MRRATLLWLAYFVLLLLMAMPQGLHTAVETFTCRPNLPWPCNDGVLTPLSTNADIIRLFTTADAAFMAQHARDFALAHDWSQVTGWPLWPPGMMVLETALYRLSPDTPVALVLIVLSSALWAGAMAQMNLLLGRRKPIIAFIAPLPLLFTPEFSYFFHRGLFYTESLSVGAFLFGTGLLAQAVTRRSAGAAGAAGCLLALSSYMRAQTDMVMSVTLLFFIASWLVYAWHSKQRLDRALKASALLGALAVALVSYHALTLPYRAAHDMQWIDMAQSPVWPPTWERKRDITPELQFYVDGGGVEACEADPKRCDAIHAAREKSGKAIYGPRDYFHFTVASVLEHPLNWAVLKYPYLQTFWMEVQWEGWVLTLLLPLMLLYCLRAQGTLHPLFLVLLLSTMLGIMGPLLLTHFESRYLYQFKLLILYFALLLAAKRAAHDGVE